ncbi:MAG: cation-translocating P-type ATPase [Eubacteriaceae bacterium]|nr:cation-translocating P-type ATPase [Eubacteriaceae bacterium]
MEPYEAMAELKTTQSGLSEKEAGDRLAKHGSNKLHEPPKEKLLKKFIAQISDPMIIMLLIAAAISTATAVYLDESFTDVFVILFVVIVNAALGIVQESKAEKAIDALKEMSADSSSVLRDGNVVEVKSEHIVPGDIVLLEAGDLVPADGRIFQAASLQIEEASLTGESVPATKSIEKMKLSSASSDITLGDRRNMAYMGTTVTYGRGAFAVSSTGMNTEMGKIASAIAEAVEQPTPLQQKLASLSSLLSKIVVGICAVIFASNIIQSGSWKFAAILESFMFAVALAVAAIPEGLPAVVTIVLSMGVTRMSKRNSVIRKLMAVETLGSTQVICSDKTGTLTQNKMDVVSTYADDKNLLAQAMCLCSDAEIKEDGTGIGDPTEIALVAMARKQNLSKKSLERQFPRVGEAPFDSNRKLMSTVHSSGSKYIQYTKGAVDVLVSKCTHKMQGGKPVLLSSEDKAEILRQNKRYADGALRVLAAAMREHPSKPSSFDAQNLERNMVFIGFAAMMDPPRPEAFAAIEVCKKAHIKPVMITGDHRDTAIAIATDLGIINSDSEAITGEQLNAISDDQLYKMVDTISVYARVQPEHKVRIVSAWQKHGKVVAMTGDGVNDAPAIKTADIGVGMGITGTDVTKNVADMVLADDNFATIVTAIEEGRRIYDNIKKVIMFQFSTNIAEVICVFIASLIGFNIFQASHLLWINLVTDSAPGLALGMEEAEGDIMLRQPRPQNESIFDGITIDLLLQGAFMAMCTMLSFSYGHYMQYAGLAFTDSDLGTTMAFLTLSLTEIFHAFNMRSLEYSAFGLKKQNFYLIGAMALSLVLTSAVIYIPVLAAIFEFTILPLKEYLIAVGLAFMVVPAVELIKLMTRKSIMREGYMP